MSWPREGHFINDYFTMTVSTSASCFLALSAALLSRAAVSAEKDTQYYPDGMSNPNAVSSKMYWADASNVLNDIGKFDALYVTHHHCA